MQPATEAAVFGAVAFVGLGALSMKLVQMMVEKQKGLEK